MKKTALLLSVLAAFAAAQVQAETMVQDTDANGSFSFEEMVAAYPELTQESFNEMDINADGQLDSDEMETAAEAGLLPE